MSWDMMGHLWATDLLQRNVASGKLRHAYLFVGPDGVGKRTLALRFTQALCCEAAPQDGSFCGTCRACRLIAAQAHPDLHVVASEAVGSALRVEQVRELQRALALAPFEARWRVALMLRFHEATIGASNALLKTLEEPNERVVMLLTARTVEELLPTIVSRCEVLRLRSLSQAELEKALEDRGTTPGQAEVLAAAAAGRPGWALRAGEDAEWLEQRSARLDDLINLLGMSRAQRFARAEKLAKDDSDLVPTLETWLAFWRDGALLRFDADASMSNPDRLADLDRITAQLGEEDLMSVLRATERTLNALDRNANARLALETLMLALPRLHSQRDASP